MSTTANFKVVPRLASISGDNVTSSGHAPKELKDLFAGCKAGLVFVTAFENRRAMQTFVSHIAWESEVWLAEDPDHMIHFNGERFLGPYPDVMPKHQ